MFSAFGVDHGDVSKSLVNGSWKAAKDLTKAERAAMGGYKKLRGVSPKHEKDREMLAATREAADNPQNAKLKDVYVHPFNQENRAVTMKFGGKSSREYKIVGTANNAKAREDLMSHELQHAKPKRSAYRFVQLHEDPNKLIREEARADYFSRYGSYKNPNNNSVYAHGARGNTEAIRIAYPKMTSAEAKRAGKEYKALQNQMEAKGVKSGLKRDDTTGTAIPMPPVGGARSRGDRFDRFLQGYEKYQGQINSSIAAAGVTYGIASEPRREKKRGTYTVRREGKTFQRRYPQTKGMA